MNTSFQERPPFVWRQRPLRRWLWLLVTTSLAAIALYALGSNLRPVAGGVVAPYELSPPLAVLPPGEPAAVLAVQPRPSAAAQLNLDTSPRPLLDQRDVTSLDWGDFDGDGDLDLALGTFQQGNRVYQNDGGQFTRLLWTDVMTDNNTSAVAWGDVDGDGDLDLAVGLRNAPNRLYRNENGRLPTTPTWTDGRDDPTSDLAWGDMDGDGSLDLVVANRYAPNRIYLNGDGLLSQTAAWSDPNVNDPTNSIDLADIDRDGDLDIAIGNANDDRIKGPDDFYEEFRSQVYRNQTAAGGSLDFAPAWSGANNTFGFDVSINAVSDVAWGDANGDGYPELALADFWCGGNDGVYPNNGGALSGSAAWNPVAPLESFCNLLGMSVAWGDVDGDGDLDLAIGYSTDTREQVYLNNGAGLDRAAAWQTSVLERAVAMAWADVDGDSDLDLTVIYGGRVNVYDNHRWSLSQVRLPDPNLWGATAVAWGDVDNDGDLDLAAFTSNTQLGGQKLYRRDETGFTAVDIGDIIYDAASITWGDVDGDGDLDLAVGNLGAPNFVLRNQDGVLDTSDPLPLATANDQTHSLAWGDVDGDGDLDLAEGNANGVNRLYLNQDGALMADNAIAFGSASRTVSLAWGDVDGDGDLDLAAGNVGQPNQLYFNENGRLSDDDVQPFGTAENSYGLAWGDVDGDGDLDLAVGNAFGLNQVYFNQNGRLSPQPGWTSGDLDETLAIALGDVDGDGDLDLAAANGGNVDGSAPQADKLYLNEGGRLQTVADPVWSPAGAERSNDVAWGDMDGDGDLDLAFAGESSLALYANNSGNAHPFRPPPAISLADPGPSPAPYATVAIADGGRIDFVYTLAHPANRSVASVRGFYSPDGGGRWLTAQPVSGTQTTDLSTTPGQNRHVYTWDVYGSGFFGQSDNVVFRLEAYETVAGEGALPPGTFGYAGQTTGQFQRATVAAASRPFRVRGNQIRVEQGGETAAAGASVYRLDPAAATGGMPLSDGTGRAYTTDAFGALQGRTTLQSGEQLIALWPAPGSGQPVTFTNRATLFYLSGGPLENGLAMTTLDEFEGAQALTVSATNPLLLFDIDVSLEWDARNDAIFLLELEEAFKRASALLFDVSDGRVALGQVRIHHAKENWLASEVVILANSSIRPSASMGGLVVRPVGDTVAGQPVAAAYVPGQIRMGTVWDPFRQNTADLGDDWQRALAHELSHFLLFLPDNYLGIDSRTGALTSIDCRGSFMTNTYDDSYSEFLLPQDWQERQPCRDNSLAARTTGRSDWETINHFYPFLTGTTRIDGPSVLPLAVTQVTFADPDRPPVTTLPPRVFDIRGPNQTFIRVPEAQAYLIQRQGTTTLTDDVAVVLGAPFGGGDRIKVRGATPARGGQEPAIGDRLCLLDLTSQTVRVGCDEVQPASASIRIEDVAGWRPDIDVQAVTSRTLLITVTNETAVPGRLQVQVYPAYGAPDRQTETPLAPTAVLTAVNGSGRFFTGTVTLDAPAFEGLVRVWSDGDDAPREAISQYLISLPFGPNDRGGSGPNDRGGSGPNDRGGSGPNDRGGSGPNDRGGSGPNDRGGSGPNDRGGSGPNDRGGSGPNDRGGSGADTRAYFANYRALGAPVQSSDGQATVYNVAGFFEDSGVGSLQSLPAAPNLASWLAPVGQAYRFTSESTFSGTRSIAFHYLQRDVPDGFEDALALYFSPDDGENWQRLEDTFVDNFENLAVAEMAAEDGIYLLAATLKMPALSPGWNALAYPLLDTRPVSVALASIDGRYRLPLYDAAEGLPPGLGAAPVDADAPQQQFTAAYNLNVRAGPGVRYPVVSLLRRGESTPVIDSDAASGWWQIACPSGAATAVCWVTGSSRYGSVSDIAPIQPETGGGTAVAPVTDLEFGHVYWIFIEGDTAVSPFLAPPGRTDRTSQP